MEIGDTAHLYRDLYTELENYEKHGVNPIQSCTERKSVEPETLA